MGRKHRRRRSRSRPWVALLTLTLAVGGVAALLVGVAWSTETRPTSVGAYTAAPMPTRTQVPTLPPLPPGSLVYVIGDSWSSGYSADPGQGYIDHLRAMTGWSIVVDAQSGTGFVATRPGRAAFPDRVQTLPADPPALILVQGGLNDTADDQVPLLADAASAMIANAQSRFPEAAIAFIGPSIYGWPASRGNLAVDSILGGVAKSANITYISPITGSWINQSNIATLIDPATKHLNNAGHAEFARRLFDRLAVAQGATNG